VIPEQVSVEPATREKLGSLKERTGDNITMVVEELFVRVSGIDFGVPPIGIKGKFREVELRVMLAGGIAKEEVVSGDQNIKVPYTLSW
jgi:hypothetical protein